MSTRVRIFCGLALVFCAALLRLSSAQTPEDARPAMPRLEFSGPYVHDNLTLFLIHGEDQLKGRKHLMLAEALEKKMLVIHETHSVNQLTMENLSGEDVVLLSGDILKGGQQDRVVQFDQIVPAKSGKVPLAVFCVEHTAERWGKAPTEKEKTFHASPGQICTCALRLASRHDGAQGEVWKNVARAQASLTKNAGVDVKTKESDSSLALSLKVKEVEDAVKRYTDKLEPILVDKKDVVGFAFAVNGKVYSADIYGSPELFRRVWPRLLHASAIEAFADLQKDKKFTAVGVADLKTFLDEANKGATKSSKDVGTGITQITTESERVLRFDAKEGKGAGRLRTNYLKR